MRKLIYMACLLLFVVGTTRGQQILYGFAGQNTAPNYTTEVVNYIENLNSDFVIDFCQYKYTGPAPQVDIDNIINLRNSIEAGGKKLYLIYSFDARNVQTIEDNFYAFDKFITAGINIIAARMGNEEWAKVAHNNNWALYETHFSPIIIQLELKGFQGKIIFPIRRPAEAGSWNTSAIAFINSSSQYEPDCHPYYNKESAPVLIDIDAGRSLPQEITTSNGYLADKDVFYKTLYNEITTSNFYEEFISYHRENFPAKKLWITEFGPAVGVGPISGALGYEASFAWFLNQTMQDGDVIAAVCRFNGPGITGSITPVSKTDIPGTGFIKRLGYYTLAQFLRNQTTTTLPVTPIAQAGSFVFSYANMTRIAIEAEGLIPVSEGFYISEFEYEHLSGENYYSSSGSCQWWAVGSDKTYEISGSLFSDGIPALSYGYIHVTVSRMEIIGCRDTAYIDYDPLATASGLCLDKKVYGSLETNCQNYNPLANIIVPCIAYPQPCMKKRWLFSGCKVAKRNCDCN